MHLLAWTKSGKLWIPISKNYRAKTNGQMHRGNLFNGTIKLREETIMEKKAIWTAKKKSIMSTMLLIKGEVIRLVMKTIKIYLATQIGVVAILVNAFIACIQREKMRMRRTDHKKGVLHPK